jgi:hypothetical protein
LLSALAGTQQGREWSKQVSIADIFACLLDINSKQSKVARFFFIKNSLLARSFGFKLLFNLLKFQNILPFFSG